MAVHCRQTRTVVSAHRRLKPEMELHMLESRLEQEAETDGGLTGGYVQQVATHMPVRMSVWV